MKNEFIPYEQALALKELGFDEPCLASWNFYTRELNYNGQPSIFSSADVIQLPTFSQAFRWFREKYKLEAIVQKADDFSWYKFTIYFYLSDSKGFVDSYHEFNTYEEAELACLKKLIEIVKSNNDTP
jgi:hypothetical protein